MADGICGIRPATVRAQVVRDGHRETLELCDVHYRRHKPDVLDGRGGRPDPDRRTVLSTGSATGVSLARSSLFFLIAIGTTFSPAFAQGVDTATTGAQSQGAQQSGAVQVGAGSKGDVTPGASGPQSRGGEGLAPAPVTFDIKPPSDPFYGPRQLPFGPPRQLRCAVIGDAGARRTCESKAAHLTGGQAND